MFLAYLDDSGTRQKDKRIFQLITAVLISDSEFFDIERHMGATVEQLLPEDRMEQFEEFHAWELYGDLPPIFSPGIMRLSPVLTGPLFL